MLKKQTTIRSKIYIQGVGLETKQSSTMILHPAKENTGFLIRRIDIQDSPHIKVNIDFFSKKAIKNIVLEKNQIEIKNLDHILAALIGIDLDNIIIELDAIEPPIMDGSAYEFIKMIKHVGILEQQKNKIYFTLDKIITYTDSKNNSEIIAVPASHFEIIMTTTFNNHYQNAYLKNIHDFQNNIAPARDLSIDDPFLFIKKNKNFIYRYPNEIARHEILDLLGYFSLLGIKLKAKIIVNNPSTIIKKEFLQKLYTYIQKNKKIKILKLDSSKQAIFDIKDIMKILPHKSPFLLVDKIIEISDKHIIGIKNVTINEYFFIGHFPNEPIMPGVLQIEVMAQVGGIFVLHDIQSKESYSTYFLKINQAKFKKKVIPGDILIIKMKLLEPIKRGIVKMYGYGCVNEDIVVEAEVMAQIVKNK